MKQAIVLSRTPFGLSRTPFGLSLPVLSWDEGSKPRLAP